MNGVTHVGHWAAIQHYEQAGRDLRTTERYEVERELRVADEIVREERKAERRARRAERWSRRQHLVQGKVRQILRTSV